MAERPKDSEKAGSLPDLEVWPVSAPTFRTPSYRHHKPSGLAVVTLNGRDIYLGRYGSPESRAEFDRLLAEWLSNGRRLPAPVSGSDLTINELALAYLRHADSYYVKNGKPTVEPGNMRLAIRPLRKLYGDTLAREFGPVALKVVRQEMVKAGNCRSEINRRISRILRVFKWGVSEELVPPSVHQALQTVPGLRRGRSDVRESEPVKPVPDAFVDVIKPTSPARFGRWWNCSDEPLAKLCRDFFSRSRQGLLVRVCAMGGMVGPVGNTMADAPVRSVDAGRRHVPGNGPGLSPTWL